MSSLASIEKRLKKIESNDGCNMIGAKHVGKYYDELSDLERNQYLEYLNSRGYICSRKAFEVVNETLGRIGGCNNPMHFICESLDSLGRNHNKPISQEIIDEVEKVLL